MLSYCPVNLSIQVTVFADHSHLIDSLCHTHIQLKKQNKKKKETYPNSHFYLFIYLPRGISSHMILCSQWWLWRSTDGWDGQVKWSLVHKLWPYRALRLKISFDTAHTASGPTRAMRWDDLESCDDRKSSQISLFRAIRFIIQTVYLGCSCRFRSEWAVAMASLAETRLLTADERSTFSSSWIHNSKWMCCFFRNIIIIMARRHMWNQDFQ